MLRLTLKKLLFVQISNSKISFRGLLYYIESGKVILLSYLIWIVNQDYQDFIYK